LESGSGSDNLALLLGSRVEIALVVVEAGPGQAPRHPARGVQQSLFWQTIFTASAWAPSRNPLTTEEKPMGTQEIYNYRKVDDQLATAGQPTEEQLRAAAADGFVAFINLYSSGPGRCPVFSVLLFFPHYRVVSGNLVCLPALQKKN